MTLLDFILISLTTLGAYALGVAIIKKLIKADTYDEAFDKFNSFIKSFLLAIKNYFYSEKMTMLDSFFQPIPFVPYEFSNFGYESVDFQQLNHLFGYLERYFTRMDVLMPSYHLGTTIFSFNISYIYDLYQENLDKLHELLIGDTYDAICKYLEPTVFRNGIHISDVKDLDHQQLNIYLAFEPIGLDYISSLKKVSHKKRNDTFQERDLSL